ncbi:hypothetical protein GPJ56_006711 [Histomonas meleagridis]|uniref:uncharacterized protein n=1 Tax=Histomonas meleagridis TaxID=135588 RepID=UPI00355A6E18|nr:hypothetical protein GPJ56_006711 [Histomonas meleagridis]KAH0806456.1 hypothetical protein GO595_000618 [Histomonas meleagridis]
MNSIPKKFPLLVYFPGRCVIKVSIYPTSAIANLKRLAPYDSVAFLYNGQYLIETFSFEFYGIKPRDVLVIVQSNQSGDFSKWLNLTRDTDTFSDRISSIINQKTSREAARIRDFQLIRMERKPRAFRKLCSAKMSRIGESAKSQQSTTNISYERPTMPSTEALPSFWDIPNTTPQNNCIESTEAPPYSPSDADGGSLKQLQTPQIGGSV